MSPGARPVMIEFARFSRTSGVENADLRFLRASGFSLSLSLSLCLSRARYAPRSFTTSPLRVRCQAILTKPELAYLREVRK